MCIYAFDSDNIFCLFFDTALHYSGVNAALNINITDSGGLSTWATYRFLVYDVPDLPVLTLTSNSVSVPIGSPLSLGLLCFVLFYSIYYVRCTHDDTSSLICRAFFVLS